MAGSVATDGQGWRVTFFAQTFVVSVDEAGAQFSRLADEMQKAAERGKAAEQDYSNNEKMPIISTICDWAGGAEMPDGSLWDLVISAAGDAKVAAGSGDCEAAAVGLNEADTKYNSAESAWSDYLSRAAKGTVTVEKDALEIGIGVAAVGVGIATGGTGLGAMAAIGAGEGALSDAVDQWVDIHAGNQKSFNFGSLARDTVVDSLVWAISGAVGDKLADAVTSKCVSWFTDVNPEVLETVNQYLGSKGLEAIDGVELMSWIPANITRVLRYIPDAIVSAAAWQALSALANWTMDGFVGGFPNALWECGSADVAQAIGECMK
jgi:hypothetical protein